MTDLAADEAFAMGDRTTAGQTTFTDLLEWDGSAWHQVRHPDPGMESRFRGLTGIDASSQQDAWAVGQYYALDGRLRNETLHFDGTRWLLVASRGDRGSDLNGVSDVSPVKAFAVGYNLDEGGYVLDWNGMRWRFFPHSG